MMLHRYISNHGGTPYSRHCGERIYCGVRGHSVVRCVMARTRSLLLLVCTLLLLTTACDRRELIEPTNGHIVRVYLNEEIKNVTTGFYNPALPRPPYTRPDILRVVMYNTATGRMVTDRYLRDVGEDEHGYWVEGYVICEPGSYDMIIYNSALEAIIVKQDANLHDLYATTNPVTFNTMGTRMHRSASEPLLYNSPDLLFLSHNRVDIPFSYEIDTINSYVENQIKASAMVETYYLQIQIKGANFVQSVQAVITGMGSEKQLFTQELPGGEAALLFEMPIADYEITDSIATIYTTFNTFGKLNNVDNTLTITFNILTTTGQMQSTVIDVSDEFLKPHAIENNWLIIDKVINVPPPPDAPSGGFTPGVTRWDDIWSDIYI